MGVWRQQLRRPLLLLRSAGAAEARRSPIGQCLQSVFNLAIVILGKRSLSEQKEVTVIVTFRLYLTKLTYCGHTLCRGSAYRIEAVKGPCFNY